MSKALQQCSSILNHLESISAKVEHMMTNYKDKKCQCDKLGDIKGRFDSLAKAATTMESTLKREIFFN